MKKKIFTLLALALCICSAAWSADLAVYTLKLNNGVTQTPSGSSFFTVATGGGFNSKYAGTYDGTEYTKGLKINTSSSITFTTSVKTDITIVQSTSSNSANKFKLGGQSVAHDASGSITISETAVSYTMTENTTNKYLEFVFTGVPSGDLSITNDGETGLFFVKVEEKEVSTTPTLVASPKTLSLNVTPSSPTKSETFTLTGANLTAGETLNIAPSTTVEGLSVSPSSVTIGTDGTLSQKVTVSYAPKADATASSVNINATTSTTALTAEVTVNYSAKVVAYEMQPISNATTFELKNTGTELATVSPDDYVLLANAGSTASFAENIAVKGVGTLNVTWRTDAIQAGYFKFNTTVPGTVTVKFSDTGGTAGESSTRAPRYANVNGTRSDVSSNGSNGGVVTCSPINVAGGDVVIRGEQYNSDKNNYTDNQIRVFEIVFTPAAATTINLNGKGYATYSNYYDVAVSGAKVYTAELDFNNAKITCHEVSSGKVPAGQGVLLYGDANAEVTLTPTTGAGDLTNNQLHATTLADGTLVSKESEDCYSLSGDTFKKYTGESFVANKAYFEVLSSGSYSARSFTIEFVDGGYATAIDGVSAAERSADSVYDLQGRRVEKPVKGLYVVNGKKVVIK